MLFFLFIFDYRLIIAAVCVPPRLISLSRVSRRGASRHHHRLRHRRHASATPRRHYHHFIFPDHHERISSETMCVRAQSAPRVSRQSAVILPLRDARARAQLWRRRAVRAVYACFKGAGVGPCVEEGW